MCQQTDKDRPAKLRVKKKDKPGDKGKVHAIIETDSESESECDTEGSVYMVSINNIGHGRSKYTVEPSLKPKGRPGQWTPIRFQLDNGACVNCIRHSDLCKIMKTDSPQMKPSGISLTSYSGDAIQTEGEVTLCIRINNKSVTAKFQVINKATDSLLCGETSERLGLMEVKSEFLVNSVTSELTREEVVKEYRDVFTGLGDIGEYRIELKDNAKPKQDAPRSVPFSFRTELKQRLEQMVKEGHIIKVKDPTDWISSAVYVKKPNKLRVCLDPKELNKFVKVPKYRLPTLEDITPQLAKARVFSVCDAKDGFLQIRLDKASQDLTCFHTPFGRYKWLRLPFGISSAPEEFQRRTLEILEGLDGVFAKADDIIIGGVGDSYEEAVRDHDSHMRKFLERCRERNFKLNPKKLRFKQESVVFHGHVLSSEGLRADPSKIQAIKEMPRPRDKGEVKRFLGMVNYLGKFCAHLSEVSEPLRDLTKENRPFLWGTVHEEAFNRIKDVVTGSPVLKFYDVEEDVTVEADASDYGLGAVLLQLGQPVAYASRTMTATERRYSQMEKECLALTFACGRFNDYLHGRHKVMAITDHKPLEQIFKKSINQAPKRLQRMRLRLQKYHLDVHYQPGSKMHISDHLSRSVSGSQKKVDRKKTDYDVFQVEAEHTFMNELEEMDYTMYHNVSDQTLRQIAEDTATDDHLQELMGFILNGFPNDKRDFPKHLHAYWTYRDELSCQNGVCYRGTRVIIPSILRPEMLDRIHRSHQGFDPSLSKARDAVYWPYLYNDVKVAVEQCATCQENQTAQQKEPMRSQPIANKRWSIVSTDLFTYKDQDYVLVVDNLTKYWEIDVLHEMSASETIDKIKAIFARHGVPELVISDNGPQYANKEFKAFSDKWGFTHYTSSPHHSQGNGTAEAAVKTAKKMLSRSNDPWLAILEHRNTPVRGYSPAQKLLSRRTRSTLPLKPELLEPEVIPIKTLIDQDIRKKQHNKRHYDKTAKELPPLVIGSQIRAKLQPKSSPRWTRGQVVERNSDRSYIIEAEGRKYRRARGHIRDTKELKNNSNHELEVQTDVQVPTPSVSTTPKSHMSSPQSGPSPMNQKMTPAKSRKSSLLPSGTPVLPRNNPGQTAEGTMTKTTRKTSPRTPDAKDQFRWLKPTRSGRVPIPKVEPDYV